MKLLFTYDIFYLQKYGGISSYFVNLTKEFVANEKDINISCKIYKNLNLHNLNMKVNGYKINYPYFLNNMVGRVNNYFFQKDVKKIKPDITHFTYFNSNFNLQLPPGWSTTGGIYKNKKCMSKMSKTT